MSDQRVRTVLLTHAAFPEIEYPLIECACGQRRRLTITEHADHVAAALDAAGLIATADKETP
jgi:hypothetical protein